MALALMAPALASAATPRLPFDRTDALAAMSSQRVSAGTRLYWEGVLRRSSARFPSKNEGVCIGDWYLHPDGFAVKMPDGMTPLLKYRGTALMLVGKENEGASLRTSISIATNAKDTRLKTMTRESVISLYAGQFDRFTLRSIWRENRFGTECVRLSFSFGNPQVFVEQCLFEKNGRGYVITLMAENSVRTLPTAWVQFQTFCDSLFFAQKRPNEKSH